MSGARDDNAGTNRLHELLADRATEGLAPDQADELTKLMHESRVDDDDSMEWVAAAVDLQSIAHEIAPMPASLRAKVEVDAVAWLARSKGLTVVDAGGAHVAAPTPRDEPAPIAPAARAPGLSTWIPWLLAAACIVMAVTAWWPGAVDLDRDRQALLDRDGTRLIPWNDPLGLGVTGDVVWNDDAQSGYMRFAGLAINDPKAMQYQLWIFDGARQVYSESIAVDGGVFDVDAATGVVIVPIHAKLDVAQPTLFAVTTEPPGGVVKHNPDRDPDKYKIILTAPV